MDGVPHQRRRIERARAPASLMELVLIAAVAENGVIGRAGTLPWRLKSDMQRFRALTWGKPIVVGRKTYLSFAQQPLPGRTNIVVTRDPGFATPGALVTPSLPAALDAARGDALRRGTDIMVLGGADIYAQTIRLADRLEITHVRARAAGDAVFPAIDPALWREAARQAHPAGPDDDAPFDSVTYVRIKDPAATLGRGPRLR
jgi:dihydrofolate reductase